MLNELIDAAYDLRSPSGKFRDWTLRDILDSDGGLAWLRWCARRVVHSDGKRLDAARRGAARVLLEVVDPPDAATIAERDLADELLTVAALRAHAEGDL